MSKEYEKIIIELENGRSNKEVAEELNYSELTVRRCYRANKLGLELSQKDKENIVKGEDYKRLTEWIREETEKKIIELYNSKKSLDEIATAVGTTKTRVCQMLRELATRENPKVNYHNGEKTGRLSMAEKEATAARVNTIKMTPKRIVIGTRKYLDVTALYAGV